jgi:hypothetical protein
VCIFKTPERRAAAGVDGIERDRFKDEILPAARADPRLRGQRVRGLLIAPFGVRCRRSGPDRTPS